MFFRKPNLCDLINQLLWDFEIQMCPDFEQAKKYWFTNFLDFKWDLKSGSPTIFKSRQIVTTLLKTIPNLEKIHQMFRTFRTIAVIINWPFKKPDN